MRRSTSLVIAALLALGAAGAFAQAAQQGQSTAPQAEPSRSKVAPEDAVPAHPAPGGIQGQNIFDVKPEVKKDAANEPGYMEQNNGQRNRVQPGNNAPMWRGAKSGMKGTSSLPDSDKEWSTLIQGPVQYPGSRYTTAGEAWRQVRNTWIIPYGGSLVIISALALGLFFLARGALGHNPAVGGGGRRIERFTPFERAAHWTNAIAFCVLAISGIVMGFGKFFILPVIGHQLFGWLTYVLKNLHNFFGPLFAVSLVIVLVTFIKDEFPKRGDLAWLLRIGQVLSRHSEQEPPTHRFNTGEKIVFWIGAFVLGLVLVGSGLLLDKVLPSIEYVRATMQQAHMIHATAAVLMICITGLHIYLGTIGVRGAYRAMRDGYVDEAWAKEHHGYWYEDLKSGRIPAERSQPVVTAEQPPEQARPA